MRRNYTAQASVSACKGGSALLLKPYTTIDAVGFHDDQLPLLEPLIADHLREQGITDYLV
jgi:hypothetical protein